MALSKGTVGIYTIGCKVNQYESEAIAELFTQRGFEVLQPSEVCDAYVINTCTVTAESDRKARQFIRRARSENPSAFILVTGCMAQSRPEQAIAIEGVDYICGSSCKLSVVDEAEKFLASGKKNITPFLNIPALDTAPFEKMKIKHFERTRAYLKIEDGCENRCSYCAIPDARGPIRSKAPADVIAEVNELTAGGCREIVLTGIETASYGRDLNGVDIIDVLSEIDKIEGIGRIRLGSLDPSVMTDDFVERIAKIKCLAPHFHLSMQSGSNRILELMRRKYTRETALHNIENLRAHIRGAMFTTDFIVGFPGETDEDFALSIDLAKRARFLDMHVFAYSKRSGTPAAEMKDQIDEGTKKQRSAALIALGKEIRKNVISDFAKENETTEVLFETFDGVSAYGHTASFVPVSVKSEKPLHAESRKVKNLVAEANECRAELDT